MAQKKKDACAYCNDVGWSQEFWKRYGWHKSGRQITMKKDEPVYECPYCHRPDGAELPPKGMFPRFDEK